jgi:hypothetical protein
VRNLVEYPITDQEICACLKDMAEQCNAEDLVGDMRAVLLMTAADIIASRHLFRGTPPNLPPCA